MSRFFTFVIAVSLFTLAHQSQAVAEIVSAGEPREVRVNTEINERYPDIYTRQLAYPAKRHALLNDLKARQQSFVKPHIELKEQYKQNLKKYHESIKSE